MGRQVVYQPKKHDRLHLVYVHWHEGTRPLAAYYGPFDNVADAAGFEAAFAREHRGVVDDWRIEDVTPVERMETFEA